MSQVGCRAGTGIDLTGIGAVAPVGTNGDPLGAAVAVSVGQPARQAAGDLCRRSPPTFSPGLAPARIDARRARRGDDLRAMTSGVLASLSSATGGGGQAAPRRG
ncbi:MAG: hypothetical protein R3D85_06155 [Paracoccaceae bacterium]